MTDLKSMSLPELTQWMLDHGEKKFRARQLYGWMHEKQVSSYDEMTDLPVRLRENLEGEGALVCLKTQVVQVSRLDGTRKYLFRLADGNDIESVFMPYRHGNSVCISSQVGCSMGCSFCASTIGGKLRNLCASEMLDQVYRIKKDIGERISNVVVMGTGEPLDNYDNLLKFIRMLTGEGGLHLSQRNVTVSTCGLADRIRALAEEKLQITLALSLHAPNDEIRRQLMPVAYRYSIEEVLDACRYYFACTGRRVTFEYSLCKGVNDRREHAAQLGSMLKGWNAHINLIPVNPVRERRYLRSSRREVDEFKNELEKYGNNVTIRREMGADIDGACGQLRSRYRKRDVT